MSSVTNRRSATSRFVSPSAASRATRRPLAVSVHPREDRPARARTGSPSSRAPSRRGGRAKRCPPSAETSGGSTREKRARRRGGEGGRRPQATAARLCGEPRSGRHSEPSGGRAHVISHHRRVGAIRPQPAARTLRNVHEKPHRFPQVPQAPDACWGRNAPFVGGWWQSQPGGEELLPLTCPAGRVGRA